MRIFAFILLLASASFQAQAAEPEIEQFSKLLEGTTQVVVVVPVEGILAQTSAYEFRPQGNKWVKFLGPFNSTTGYRSFAQPGSKREGDGKTPSGIFALGDAFGYAEKMETRLSYRQAGADDYWVDDAESPQYNQWVHGKPNAKSFEKMRRSDQLYSAGFIVEYNTSPVVKGAGSAIFFHVWKNKKKPTAGCVAMEDSNLHSLLRWLDPKQKPRVILNPDALK